MNKSAEQLFTCFLAAAERYRAPKKEQDADLQHLPAEIRGIQSLEASAGQQSNTILETSKEQVQLRKYLDRVYAITQKEHDKIPYTAVSKQTDIAYQIIFVNL